MLLLKFQLLEMKQRLPWQHLRQQCRSQDEDHRGVKYKSDQPSIALQLQQKTTILLRLPLIPSP